MKYRDLWLAGAADDYYRRNKKDMGQRENDPVMTMMRRFARKGGSVLEVGCGNGWRLEEIVQEFGSSVRGIDPSADAINDAFARGVEAQLGTADDLHFVTEQFDTVIMGYVLWFIEPELWFRVAAEVDRVLADKGVLIIHDFISPRPFRLTRWGPDDVSDKEREVAAFLHDYQKLWLAHPWYRLVSESVGLRSLGKLAMFESCAVLHKAKGNVLQGDYVDTP